VRFSLLFSTISLFLFTPSTAHSTLTRASQSFQAGHSF
jgi:hypothetical protein